MFLVGYDLTQSETVNKYVKDFNNRLNRVVGAQLFNGSAKIIKTGTSKGLINVELKVLLAPFHYFFLFACAGTIIFKVYGVSIFMISLFLLFVFLRSKYFFYLMFKKGLRKAGYNKTLRLL